MLTRAGVVINPHTSTYTLQLYLNSLSGNEGNRHAHYRALRAYFNWLYSKRSPFKLRGRNPIVDIDPPIPPKRILPALTATQVAILIDATPYVVYKTIIALLCESGLRLNEVATIKVANVDTTNRIMKVRVKGGADELATYGTMTATLLAQWLDVRPSSYKTLFGLSRRGIQSYLIKHGRRCGLPCNPHTFRRTFAVLLREAGVDTLDIKDLGRWHSVAMVERYTRSVDFKNAARRYVAPLRNHCNSEQGGVGVAARRSSLLV